MNIVVSQSVLTGCAASLLAASVAAQQPSTTSLDSLLNTRVSTASKYAQTSAQAPASVTIVTAEEIRQHRYRNLAEVLEGVRGFYVSNDRNYPYLGARGFSRPTDYNNRILLLIDSHALNDQTWGGAPFGSELPINLEAIERIEIVRGPGSALYGTSAMFGVINIVTKTGTQLDRTIVTASTGSEAQREVAVATGRAFGERGSIALSAVATRMDGGDLYFAEYDTPQQNSGVARGMDWERGVSALAKLTWNELSVNGGFRSRRKGIPTGAYGAAFGDPRMETLDRTAWADVAVRREIRGSLRLSGRLYGDHYTYEGSTPWDAGPTYDDGGGSSNVGGEAMAVWDVASRNRLTIGSEFRHVARSNYWERQPDGTHTADDTPFDVASAYVQNELQMHPRFALITGVRHDAKVGQHSATAPRVAVVANPDEHTTIKLLAGDAFRSPSSSEATLSTTFYVRNPSLKPERARTVEVEVQRRLAPPILFAASVYTYRIRDLIEQVEIDANRTLSFRNVASVKANGMELQLDVVPSGPLSTRASYTLQKATDRATGAPLTNSPEHTAQLSVVASRRGAGPAGLGGLRSAIAVRYESGRRTLAGTTTRAFTRTDATFAYALEELRAPSWARGGEVSVRVTNLFDVTYTTPAGVEHLQESLPQYGRMISLRLDWRF
jgi:outer membrane cobalamin receptor